MRNRWIQFLVSNGGKGLTMRELRRKYRGEKPKTKRHPPKAQQLLARKAPRAVLTSLRRRGSSRETASRGTEPERGGQTPSFVQPLKEELRSIYEYSTQLFGDRDPKAYNAFESDITSILNRHGLRARHLRDVLRGRQGAHVWVVEPQEYVNVTKLTATSDEIVHDYFQLDDKSPRILDTGDGPGFGDRYYVATNMVTDHTTLCLIAVAAAITISTGRAAPAILIGVAVGTLVATQIPLGGVKGKTSDTFSKAKHMPPKVKHMPPRAPARGRKPPKVVLGAADPALPPLSLTSAGVFDAQMFKPSNALTPTVSSQMVAKIATDAEVRVDTERRTAFLNDLYGLQKPQEAPGLETVQTLAGMHKQ
ncbi:hypothetical protein JKP88DRAFT_255627 [Tribonema minus]|uniref:Uncharacterized protein n=1 Tax=Tribonema minus TaxID=303371 RepID=A0A835Z7W0_9STRA|nr:hypothetical protein JKP88DRAFT_255627 [Tribonema minus]